MSSVGIAVIGAGYMAEEHIKAFAGLDGVTLLGITSRTLPRAVALQGKYGIAATYESVEALHAGTKADLVVVAVPELSTAGVCHQVFRFPWVSLIEKPVGYNYEQAAELALAAKHERHTAYVALNRRHYSSTRGVLAEVASVDEKRLVNVYDQENPLAALEAGRPPLVVENWMYANSIHIIDYLSLFCRGEMKQVQHVIPWQAKQPQFVLTKFEYSSGDVGVYQAVWNAPGPWAVTVSTQSKRWEMRPLEQATRQLYKSRTNTPLEIDARDTLYKPGLHLQAEEALRAVRGEPHFLPTLDDALQSMALVRMIYDN